MKIGDLVVRIWCDKPLYDMIGIIIEKSFQPKPSGGAEWKYGILWNKKSFLSVDDPSNCLGSWVSQEFKVINESR
tara:strand:+ start:193 stop:417 length:225 start_codon:yes stop_codon:yes gene_type:complete